MLDEKTCATIDTAANSAANTTSNAPAEQRSSDPG